MEPEFEPPGTCTAVLLTVYFVVMEHSLFIYVDILYDGTSAATHAAGTDASSREYYLGTQVSSSCIIHLS